MSKEEDARKKLDEVLKGLMTDKNMMSNDKYLISANNRPSSHYEGSLTDPKVRKTIETKRIEGVERAKAEGKYSSAQKERYKNPEERKKTGLASKKSAQDPKVKERKSIAQTKAWADPSKRKKASESHKKQWADPSKRKQLSDTMKALRRKPIVTPDGVFIDQESAAIHYNLGEATIAYRRNKYPKEYYYITKEEYIMLTGKDPFNEK